MLKSLGLVFDGRHHSGLDDSINIARIALELMKVRFHTILFQIRFIFFIGWLCSIIK